MALHNGELNGSRLLTQPRSPAESNSAPIYTVWARLGGQLVWGLSRGGRQKQDEGPKARDPKTLPELALQGLDFEEDRCGASIAGPTGSATCTEETLKADTFHAQAAACPVLILVKELLRDASSEDKTWHGCTAPLNCTRCAPSLCGRLLCGLIACRTHASSNIRFSSAGGALGGVQAHANVCTHSHPISVTASMTLISNGCLATVFRNLWHIDPPSTSEAHAAKTHTHTAAFSSANKKEYRAPSLARYRAMAA